MIEVSCADVTVVLPEWLFEAVCDPRLVLTLHQDYFLLTGGIERWLYRIVRKGAGSQAGGWQWKLRTLHQRSGTTQAYKYFARELRKIVAHGMLLDYALSLETKSGEPFLRARRTSTQRQAKVQPAPEREPIHFLRLSTDTYEKAKRAVPGFDVYALEKQWQEFNAGREAEVRKPDAAFIAFCKKHAQRNPIPAR